MKTPIYIILTLSILVMGCQSSESGKEVSEEKNNNAQNSQDSTKLINGETTSDNLTPKRKVKIRELFRLKVEEKFSEENQHAIGQDPEVNLVWINPHSRNFLIENQFENIGFGEICDVYSHNGEFIERFKYYNRETHHNITHLTKNRFFKYFTLIGENEYLTFSIENDTLKTYVFNDYEKNTWIRLDTILLEETMKDSILEYRLLVGNGFLVIQNDGARNRYDEAQQNSYIVKLNSDRKSKIKKVKGKCVYAERDGKYVLKNENTFYVYNSKDELIEEIQLTTSCILYGSVFEEDKMYFSYTEQDDYKIGVIEIE